MTRRSVRTLLAVLSGLCFIGKGWAASSDAPSFTFQDLRVEHLSRGRTKLPDFAARDRAFRNYRTRIRDGLREGPNFAGAYSVVQVGCGSGCSLLFVASNATGQVFAFPRGAKNPSLQAYYHLNSTLFIVQWADYEANRCQMEYFDWLGGSARLLETKSIGGLEVCGADIRQNFADEDKRRAG